MHGWQHVVIFHFLKKHKPFDAKVISHRKSIFEGTGKRENMKIVNETLANIYSERLFNNVCSKKIKLQDVICNSKKNILSDKFNYQLFIKNLRLDVDELLKSGKINQAEKQMESARAELESKGFYVRKINQ